MEFKLALALVIHSFGIIYRMNCIHIHVPYTRGGNEGGDGLGISLVKTVNSSFAKDEKMQISGLVCCVW